MLHVCVCLLKFFMLRADSGEFVVPCGDFSLEGSDLGVLSLVILHDQKSNVNKLCIVLLRMVQPSLKVCVLLLERAELSV